MGSARPALASRIACWADDGAVVSLLGQTGLALRLIDQTDTPDGDIQLLIGSLRLYTARANSTGHRWVVVGDQVHGAPNVVATLPASAPPDVARRLIEAVLAQQKALLEAEELRGRLKLLQSDLAALNHIGRALSAEHDTDRLLQMILAESRRMTSSDAGSLYLVVKPDAADSAPALAFKVAQNDSIAITFEEFRIPLDRASIAGYVATTGEPVRIEDAYRPVAGVPYRFNTAFDRNSGYLTRSILAVPMKNAKAEMVGVLQLINRKRTAEARLRSKADLDANVIRYSRRDQELISSLASQAAVAVENSTLYQEIERLFEGFVHASVSAIEARDPATSGHSFRVADLTVTLADAVGRCTSGPYADCRFTAEQMRELRYASLLHDFGKVGVRENVLVKAEKLYPSQLSAVRERANTLRAIARAEDSAERLRFLEQYGRAAYRRADSRFRRELDRRLRDLDAAVELIERCNQPRVLPGGDYSQLQRLAALGAESDAGWLPLLAPGDLQLLSIPKGNLDEKERREIESHVIHSFNFLRQIPWTRTMRDVPVIARGHHEKLDGSGYPYGIRADAIPVQTRMMTISDIFDALAAADRPYKRAVPVEKALDILADEAGRGMLDEHLLKVFLEAKVYERLQPRTAHGSGRNE
jgi:HD-GYP domain-containing protein (c-di-GMP phosphodiesterase class II)